MDILLANCDEHIAIITLTARSLVIDNVDGVNEQADQHANMMEYGL